MRQLGHERVDGLCDEDTVAVGGGFVADASMTALPADIDPDARKHAAQASSRSPSELTIEPSRGESFSSLI